MAKHLIVLIVDDEYDDLDTEDKLDQFVFELKGCTHFPMRALYDWNTSSWLAESEED